MSLWFGRSIFLALELGRCFFGNVIKCRWAGLFPSRRPGNPAPADQRQPFHSLLHGAELHPDDELRLGGHVLEDVRLQPPEHVGAQQVVKLLDLVLLGDVGKLLQEALQVAAHITIQGRRN